MKIDGIGHGRDLLMEAAGMVAEGPRHGIVGDDAKPDLVGYENDRPLEIAEAPDQPPRLLRHIALSHHQVGDPEGEAIDQHDGVGRRQRRQHSRQIQRFFDGGPALPAPGAVFIDAGRHLAVPGPARREIDRPWRSAPPSLRQSGSCPTGRRREPG